MEESSSGVVVALGDTRVILRVETADSLLFEEVDIGDCCRPGWCTSYIGYFVPRGRQDLHRRRPEGRGGRAGLLRKSNLRIAGALVAYALKSGQGVEKGLSVWKVDLEIYRRLDYIKR